MKNPHLYKMIFGQGGRTVDYADETGKFRFVFDIDPDEPRPKGVNEMLLLSKRPIKDKKIWECRTQADQEHLALMLERVQKYLLSLGFDSKVSEI